MDRSRPHPSSLHPASSIRRRIPLAIQQRGIFYGWIIVLICFLSLSLIFGVRLSFSLFFEELTRSAEFGWTRGNTAGVFSISMLVFALFSAPSGWLLDRLGPRRLFSLGLLIVASGLLLTSRMHSLGEFYLFYGVWTGIGVTMLGLTMYAATISTWFGREGRRGLAIGIAFSGSGIGVLVLAPVLERVITLYGWRQGYLLLTALIALVALPLVWIFMWDNPRALGLLPDGESATAVNASPANTTPSPGPTAWTWQQAARTARFWFLMLSGLMSLFTLRMVTVHQVAYMVDQGVPRLLAALVVGIAGLVTALAFIAFGGLSDRIGRKRAFYLGGAAHLIALALLIRIRPEIPPPYLFAYAVFWGLGEGSRSSLLTALASDAFPGPALGAIVGTLGAFFALGAGLGSWLGGFIYDWLHTYRPAFVLAFVATLLAMAGVYLQDRGRRP